jgi:hypothetical protein
MIVFDEQAIIDVEREWSFRVLLGISAQIFPPIPPTSPQSTWWIGETTVFRIQRITFQVVLCRFTSCLVAIVLFFGTPGLLSGNPHHF